MSRVERLERVLEDDLKGGDVAGGAVEARRVRGIVGEFGVLPGVGRARIVELVHTETYREDWLPPESVAPVAEPEATPVPRATRHRD